MEYIQEIENKIKLNDDAISDCVKRMAIIESILTDFRSDDQWNEYKNETCDENSEIRNSRKLYMHRNLPRLIEMLDELKAEKNKLTEKEDKLMDNEILLRNEKAMLRQQNNMIIGMGNITDSLLL